MNLYRRKPVLSLAWNSWPVELYSLQRTLRSRRQPSPNCIPQTNLLVRVARFHRYRKQISVESGDAENREGLGLAKKNRESPQKHSIFPLLS